jgi:hypothetical protein
VERVGRVGTLMLPDRERPSVPFRLIGHHQIRIGREVLRQLMVEATLWRAKAERRGGGLRTNNDAPGHSLFRRCFP